MKTSALFLLATLLAGPALADSVKTAIHPEGANPIAPYTPGVKLANGMLFVSGQIAYVGGEIPANARDGVDDIQDQTEIVMQNIKDVLDEAGYTFNDAVRATVFLSDIGNFGPFNSVYGKYWNEGDIPPARAAVEVGALPGGKPGAPVLVEVSMILAK